MNKKIASDRMKSPSFQTFETYIHCIQTYSLLCEQLKVNMKIKNSLSIVLN